MNREERKYFYEKLRELFAEWVNDANTDIKSHIYDTITSFEERYMTSITGQQPFPQELFRVFLEEHALVHKLQQRGAFKVVEELPAEDIDIYSIYLLRKGTTTEEYIYYNGEWVYLGDNDVDLSIFYTQQDVDSLLKEKADVTTLGQVGESVGKLEAQQKKDAELVAERFDGLDKTISTNQETTSKVFERIEGKVDGKQNKIDASLETKSKSIIGAINEVRKTFNQHLLEYNALGELVLRIESDVDILKQKGIYTVVNSLPDIGKANIIYLVPNEKSDDRNIKDEYMWINDKWELIGTTSIDLSGYAEEGWVTNQISAFEEETVAPISLRVEKVEDSITTKADKSEFNTFALKVKGRHGEQSITLTTNNITQ